MNRMLGLIVVVIVLLTISTPGHAQMTSAGSLGTEGYEYRGDAGVAYGYQPFGGFGFDYGQVPNAGAVMTDRFGMLYATPAVVPPPAAPAQQTRSRQTRARSNRTAVQTGTQLPTGSLYWPAATGVSLYSPADRYQSYGRGYARSPYGGIDSGTMWMGWPLGY